MANQLRVSSSISSFRFPTRSYKQDVFLSFRGEDTRYNFTGNLYSNLVKEGIKTFIDDELSRGENISQALLQAIEDSKLSLIVFSKNYAASKWCLDELVHILECRRSNNQMVWPIFYKVDPSDVRKETGSYGDALAEHERNLNKDKVSRWREALTEAANLCGSHFKDDRYEHEFIGEIVKEISTQVREPRKLDVAKNPVGVDSRVGAMLKMLDVGGSDVRMVGIWGTGGIGKTEIAKAVYNRIAGEFDVSCFLPNVREKSEPSEGLVKLQNVLLSAVMKEKVSEIDFVDEGITLLRERLRDKRILLVVDDVDDLDQLEKLAGGTNWFGGGSRVIITTRDKHLLDDHQVKRMYNVPQLYHHEAVELFSSKAFEQDTKNFDYNEKQLICTVVDYAGGIPLALEVLGSHLRRASIHKWQAMLDGFRENHPNPIKKILKVSYDGLEHAERKVFLDIACFFKGWEKNDVIQKLEACDRSNPEHSINTLEAKALIYVDRYDRIRMHDLLEEMGKDKVKQESPEPGKRSRLWHHRDVQDVLTKNTGTSNIEGIMVKMPTEDWIQLSPTCFRNMENLKMVINVNGRLCGKVDYLPTKLRLLDWPKCPLLSLPSDLNTSHIVQLNMRGSRISRLEQGFKSMPNLKSLDLAECELLKESPDLTGSPNLMILNLSGCKRLEKVHHSVGSLEKLVHLGLYGCSNLVALPGKVNWPSLKTIQLGGCRKLESFPEIVGEMKYMTGFKALLSSPGNLSLHRLALTWWARGIVFRSECIGEYVNLRELVLGGCMPIPELPPIVKKRLRANLYVSLEPVVDLVSLVQLHSPYVLNSRLGDLVCQQFCFLHGFEIYFPVGF